MSETRACSPRKTRYTRRGWIDYEHTDPASLCEATRTASAWDFSSGEGGDWPVGHRLKWDAPPTGGRRRKRAHGRGGPPAVAPPALARARAICRAGLEPIE